MTIMIVDPTTDDRLGLERALRRAGYQHVVTAQSLTEAYALLGIDREAGQSVVFGTDEDDAGPPVIWQIVRKRTDRFTRLH